MRTPGQRYFGNRQRDGDAIAGLFGQNAALARDPGDGDRGRDSFHEFQTAFRAVSRLKIQSIGGPMAEVTPRASLCPRSKLDRRPAGAPIRRSTFATVVASHFPPRAVAIPRPSRAAAISRSVLAPAPWASRIAGATLSRRRLRRPGPRVWPLRGPRRASDCRAVRREPWRRRGRLWSAAKSGRALFPPRRRTSAA